MLSWEDQRALARAEASRLDPPDPEFDCASCAMVCSEDDYCPDCGEFVCENCREEHDAQHADAEADEKREGR